MKPTLMLLFSCLFVLSCRKETVYNNENNLIQDAIKYYQANEDHTPSTSSNLPRHNLKRIPNWQKAKVILNGITHTVLVPVNFEQNILVRSSLRNDLFSLNDISYITLTPLENDKYLIKWITVIPSLQNNSSRFDGIINIENENKEFEYAMKFENNNKYISIARNSPVKTDGIIGWEHYLEGYNYSPDDPSSGYAWREYIGTTYVNVPDGYSYSGGGTTNSGPGMDLDLGAIMDDAANTSTTNFVVPAGDDKILDINDYTKCFNNKTGSQYQVTIYVQQPFPGTRSTWIPLDATGTKVHKSPVFVGHTFISLKQVSGNESITRNAGYYPSTAVNPISPMTNGELNNDQNKRYDISLSVDITYEEFSRIIAYLNSGIRYYNLNTFNCTTFALEALSKGGINLPRTEGSWPSGSGLNPGDLGEDIRDMKLSSNMSRSTTATAHKNEGTCN
ncbi:hypothetical protein [Pseudoflavitalea rhizosphaerae]|uniref:hypothetical protein n=1 Tax=Pseudoflavitalea rhizosphaerae TaxID=1884793 RepID=UPI000F8EF52C|nr:hypothetical protein [Pseudoflavitalea rhizosphaerae]